MEDFFAAPPVVFSTGGGMPALLSDTIRNFERAIGAGADAIRTNVGISSDGRLLLYSDDLFNHGVIAGSGLSAGPAAELRTRYRDRLAARVSSDSVDDIDGVFPELETALGTFPGLRFNLHCAEKSPALMEAVKQAIERTGAQERVIISSMSGYNARWSRKEMPSVPTAFSFYGMICFYGLFRSGLIYAKKRFQPRVLIIPEMIGGSYIANSGLIQLAHDRGIRVYVQQVDTAKQAATMKQAGADGIVTNDVPVAGRAFREHARD